MKEQYQQGFNEGYLIARHLPDLSAHIDTIESAAPRIEGMKDGGQQFLLEQTRERRPAWLKGEAQKTAPASPSKDKQKDKDPDR